MMTDKPHAPAALIEALERSIAQIAAGQTVSGDDVEQRCRDTAARIKARKSQAVAVPTRRAG